jgi:uracil-DNA glycosylase family 4
MTQNPFAELNETLVACRLCPRLVAWREQVAREKRRAYLDWDYWGKPVPGFGDPAARVLVVGLAPGAHGSNRTGRMFTGDSSGDFLYAALHRSGFANQPHTLHREDGLALQDLFISAVCRCAPPDNRPTPTEIATCLLYLRQEMAILTRVQVIVALGRIAFDAILRLFAERSDASGLEIGRFHFAHGASYKLGLHTPHLIASYHPSRQNTQTGRLTPAMFDAIWTAARSLLR